MKNKRILIFTVAIICGFVLLIMLGSKAVNSTITTGKETENQLVSETSKPLIRDFEFGLDYPYFEYEKLTENTDTVGYNVYKNISVILFKNVVTGNNVSESEIGLDLITPDENMISYQTVANIGGEVSKKLCFFLRPEEYKAMITPLGSDNESVYLYCITDGEYVLQIFMDTITGQISKLTGNTYFNIERNEDIPNNVNVVVSQDVQTQLIKLATYDTDAMFYGCTPEFIDCSGMSACGYYWYSIVAKLSDGKSYQYRYITTDNQTFQMYDFRVV